MYVKLFAHLKLLQLNFLITALSAKRRPQGQLKWIVTFQEAYIARSTTAQEELLNHFQKWIT